MLPAGSGPLETVETREIDMIVVYYRYTSKVFHGHHDVLPVAVEAGEYADCIWFVPNTIDWD